MRLYTLSTRAKNRSQNPLDLSALGGAKLLSQHRCIATQRQDGSVGVMRQERRQKGLRRGGTALVPRILQAIYIIAHRRRIS